MRDKSNDHVSERLVLSTRIALVIGFGGLLATMALSGIDALRVLRQMRANQEQLRREYLFKSHLLEDIRAGLYASGTHVRDFLLDPESGRADVHRSSLEGVRSQMESSLQAYRMHLAPEEAPHYLALMQELEQYWEALSPIIEWDPGLRRDRGYVFLRDNIYPRRVAMLGIASRIGTINEQQLKTANDRVNDLLSKFQTRLGITLIATLLLGLGMAGFSARKILRLESRAHRQFQEMSEARQQLKELSARLLLTQETERRALSRELHDEVGQSLSAVLVELRNLSAGLSANAEKRLRSHVEVIKALLENTIRVVRNMSLLLRPSMLDDLGLIPALRWQAREVSKRSSVDVTVVTDLASDDLPDEHKTCIYRIVQEALHNCSRHSRATEVHVSVTEHPGRLFLSVQDNGVGFDVPQSKGLGLLGIEERVASLGGRIEVCSAPGSGTTLTINLPLPQAQNHCNGDNHKEHPHLSS